MEGRVSDDCGEGWGGGKGVGGGVKWVGIGGYEGGAERTNPIEAPSTVTKLWCTIFAGSVRR